VNVPKTYLHKVTKRIFQFFKSMRVSEEKIHNSHRYINSDINKEHKKKSFKEIKDFSRTDFSIRK